MTVLTSREALARGISRSTLTGPRFRRLFHGVYCEATEPMTVHVLIAAARKVLRPPVMITGLTALQARGLNHGDLLPLMVAGPTRVRRDGIQVVPGPVVADVAPTMRALRDCAGLPIVTQVILVERLLALDMLTLRDLGPLPGLLPAAAVWVRAGAESARETELRFLLELAGLPRPELQLEIRLPDGSFVARVDLAWPDFTVIVEYEGIQHATDPGQWSRDITRYETLQRLGWTVLRVTSAGLRDPVGLALRVDKALRANGYRGPRPVLDARWLARVCAA